ncbi:MAG: Na(+)-translocating NADH-quinone reductase subunit C [Pseudomonadales bacterium]|nr:Na(+)-translocating NADH-quinone reductase subunit C [Pseudomonadales bacterium]
MSNDSTSKTLGVALLLCVVCSVVVSTAAVVLKPIQVQNKLLDKKQNILSAAGLLGKGDVDIDALFAKIEIKYVEIASGNFVDVPEGFDQRKLAKDPSANIVLDSQTDIASIKRQSKIAEIYLARDSSGQLERIILPVHGYGLWSTLYGFLALEADANTVIGLGFYDHGETPGLGGEVDNPKWKGIWPGKKVFGDDGGVSVQLVKGGVNKERPEAVHQVDSLSGATITSRGVENLLKFWLGENGFGPLLTKFQAGEV